MALRKYWMNVLSFAIGSAIGYLLFHLLFNLILDGQVPVEHPVLYNDPHGHHSDNDKSNQLIGQMNFSADAGQHKGKFCIAHLSLFFAIHNLV